MISISKTFKFDAAHRLPYHEGKCANLHGHEYRLQVEITGKVNSVGMICDFGVLKSIVNGAFLEVYDHCYLNEFYENPTAELMIDNMAEVLRIDFKATNLKLVQLKLWETSDSFARWTNEDL